METALILNPVNASSFIQLTYDNWYTWFSVLFNALNSGQLFNATSYTRLGDYLIKFAADISKYRRLNSAGADSQESAVKLILDLPIPEEAKEYIYRRREKSEPFMSVILLYFKYGPKYLSSDGLRTNVAFEGLADVPLLEATNYREWKPGITLVLEQAGVYDMVVDGSEAGIMAATIEADKFYAMTPDGMGAAELKRRGKILGATSIRIYTVQ